jgi:basic membrane protein A
VLTSVLKRVDVTVYNAFKDDKDFKGGIVALGIPEEGVGISFDEYNKPLITDDAKAAVDAAMKGISDGTIKVHDFNADNKCP